MPEAIHSEQHHFFVHSLINIDANFISFTRFFINSNTHSKLFVRFWSAPLHSGQNQWSVYFFAHFSINTDAHFISFTRFLSTAILIIRFLFVSDQHYCVLVNNNAYRTVLMLTLSFLFVSEQYQYIPNNINAHFILILALDQRKSFIPYRLFVSDECANTF